MRIASVVLMVVAAVALAATAFVMFGTWSDQLTP